MHNKALETLIESQKETLVSLAKDIAKYAENISEWRKIAGAKSKWSGHQKMKEAGLFHALDDAVQKTKTTLTSTFPEHWEFEDWGMRTARMGTHVTWSDKQGKARGGTQLDINAGAHRIAYWMGLFLGYTVAAKTTSIGDPRRLYALDLHKEDTLVYCFNRLGYNDILYTGPGKTPQDSAAQIRLKTGGLFGGGTPTNLYVEDALRAGARYASQSTRALDWSVAPTLWKKLNKHKAVTALCGTYKPKESIHEPWRGHDFVSYDTLLHRALQLADTAGKGPVQNFLVLETGNFSDGIGAKGWNGSSAILSRIMSYLQQGKVPKDVHNWKAFSLSSEDGNAARTLFTTQELEDA